VLLQSRQDRRQDLAVDVIQQVEAGQREQRRHGPEGLLLVPGHVGGAKRRGRRLKRLKTPALFIVRPCCAFTCRRISSPPRRAMRCPCAWNSTSPPRRRPSCCRCSRCCSAGAARSRRPSCSSAAPSCASSRTPPRTCPCLSSRAKPAPGDTTSCSLRPPRRKSR